MQTKASNRASYYPQQCLDVTQKNTLIVDQMLMGIVKCCTKNWSVVTHLLELSRVVSPSVDVACLPAS